LFGREGEVEKRLRENKENTISSLPEAIALRRRDGKDKEIKNSLSHSPRRAKRVCVSEREFLYFLFCFSHISWALRPHILSGRKIHRLKPFFLVNRLSVQREYAKRYPKEKPIKKKTKYIK
jgi:hypothetical protein